MKKDDIFPRFLQLKYIETDLKYLQEGAIMKGGWEGGGGTGGDQMGRIDDKGVEERVFLIKNNKLPNKQVASHFRPFWEDTPG